MRPEFFLAIGGLATLSAGVMFYCASGQQRLSARCMSGVTGVGGGAVLTLCAVMCFIQTMSLTAALFTTAVLLMLCLCLLPIGIALLNPRSERR
jgi:hypothetical protein